MRLADVSIACGIVHHPAKSVMQVAEFAVYSQESLVRLLNQIKSPQLGKTLVISSAGTGSRLGLGQTKSLVQFFGKPLIEYQLQYFTSFDDVRVVVGFQSDDLINKVIELRKDVVFVFNRDYFHNKTGASLYLGSRFANEFVIAWDGDLVVHPDDIKKCLEVSFEYVGCSNSVTDDAVYVSLDLLGNVVDFSKDFRELEWSGPASIRRDHINRQDGHVYSIIEDFPSANPGCIGSSIIVSFFASSESD